MTKYIFPFLSKMIALHQNVANPVIIIRSIIFYTGPIFGQI